MKSKKAEIDTNLLKSSLMKLSKEEPEFLLVVQNINKEALSKINNLSEKLDMVINLLTNNSDDEIQDMEAFKNKHRIKKEVVEQLQNLWKDELPTEELIKMLD